MIPLAYWLAIPMGLGVMGISWAVVAASFIAAALLMVRFKLLAFAIGAAFATTATGPFADLGHPLAADPAVGLIDASFFEDSDGARYLLWKEDGNAASRPTPIRAQRLSADGRALAGSPTTLITNDRAWEGTVVEGPWLVAHGGSYYLFYSGSAYYDTRYAVGVARAASRSGVQNFSYSVFMRCMRFWAEVFQYSS